MESGLQDKQGTFRTHHDVFQNCNSLATFQAIMDDIFMTMIDNQLVIVYMDDILIFANTKEELEWIFKLVLEKLREHDLFLKVSGFHQVELRSSPNGLRLKGLKEYSDSCSASDYLGLVLGSKCLVM
jgi:Reverse transcriptase (RNA-dependent DNA polymerase)